MCKSRCKFTIKINICDVSIKSTITKRIISRKKMVETIKKKSTKREKKKLEKEK